MEHSHSNQNCTCQQYDYSDHNRCQSVFLGVKTSISNILISSHRNIPVEEAFQMPESYPTWQSVGASEFQLWPSQAVGAHNDL